MLWGHFFKFIFRVILPISRHNNEILNLEPIKKNIKYYKFSKKFIRATGGKGLQKWITNSLLLILLIWLQYIQGGWGVRRLFKKSG